MPKTPPKKHHPKIKPVVVVDKRSHPIPGASYRVRDKDYAELWGENLSWVDANKLKQRVVNSRKSMTARVEAEDIAPATHLEKAAYEARLRLHGTGHAAAAPVIANSPRARGTTSPPIDGQLRAIQGGAHAAAAGAAADAQKRADEKAAAGKRKAERDADLKKANDETARLAKDAHELAGGDDTHESDIDDLISGATGAPPTDEEIAKAKATPAATK
jgi:hypothetical protein